MRNNHYSPLSDASGCLMNWYILAANIIAICSYGVVAVKFLAHGDMCGFLGWTLFIGWIVAPMLGAVWPITIYLLMTGAITVMP